MFQRDIPESSKTVVQAAIVALIIMLVNLLLASCSAPPATPTEKVPPFGEEYVGRVIVETTQHVIQGSKVSLEILGEGSPPVEFTDSEGVFRFRLFINSEKSATIRVEANGFEIYTRNITISPGELRFEDIRLVPQEPTLSTSALPPSAIVEASPMATGTVSVVPQFIHPTPTHETIPNPPVIPLSPTITVPTPTVQSTNTPVPSCTELLNESWRLEGSGPVERYNGDVGDRLKGKTFIRIRYDLHGFTALSGDASAIIFDQPPFGQIWHYISLSDYGQNGMNGQQTVDISLSDFSNLNLNDPVGTLHTRFWSDDIRYTVDITSIMACN